MPLQTTPATGDDAALLTVYENAYEAERLRLVRDDLDHVAGGTRLISDVHRMARAAAFRAVAAHGAARWQECHGAPVVSLDGALRAERDDAVAKAKRACDRLARVAQWALEAAEACQIETRVFLSAPVKEVTRGLPRRLRRSIRP